MEKTLSLGAFTELDEQDVMETEGGAWIIPLIVLGVLGAAGVAAVAVSVGNHNNLVNAQNEANEKRQPVIAPQWFKEDVVVNPQTNVLEELRW